MEKTKDKFLRELNLKRKREELRQKRVSNASLVKTSLSLTRRIRNANTQFLLHQVDKGFSPYWYIVLHLKEKERRVDIYDWEEDVRHVRNMFYQTYYDGDRDWKERRHRPKAIWGIEFGKEGVRPHINLLVERTRKEWNESKLHEFFNKEICQLARCVWEEKEKAKIKTIYSLGLHGYINKETTWEFSPILYRISDIIK